MIVKVYESKEAIGTAAASLFAACVIMKPRAVLGLATGSTPILTYQRMIELYRAGAVDFSGVTTFNLDEYVGLSREHEQSYYAFMMEQLFQHINVSPSHIHVLSGKTADPAVECRAYEEMIAAAERAKTQCRPLLIDMRAA